MNLRHAVYGLRVAKKAALAGQVEVLTDAPSRPVGPENFARVWQDPIFHHSLFNNRLVVLVSAFLQVPLALWLALLIVDESRSSVVFRAICFLPYILGEVVASVSPIDQWESDAFDPQSVLVRPR
jgi:ABC-type sugar transport system permease subunit